MVLWHRRNNIHKSIKQKEGSMADVKLTTEDMNTIDREMIKMGFRNRTTHDSRKVFERLGLIPPRKIIGREEGYEYSNNGYTVKCWTSFVKSLNKFREVGKDVAWILAVEGDQALYFARPLQRRSGTMVQRFLSYAWVTKWKIDHRPLCKHCKAYMNIFRKEHSRSYMWICKNSEKHPSGKFQFESWDIGLPDKAQAFVDIRRENTKRYKAKNQKEGKHPIPAPINRNPWKVGTLENLVLKKS